MKKLFYLSILSLSLTLIPNYTFANNTTPSNLAIEISKKVDKNINGKYSYETQVIVANGYNLRLEDVINYNDRTYLPVRKVSEVLNCKIKYDEATKIVTITGDNVIIEMPQFSNKAVVNGSIVNIDNNNTNIKSILIGGTTYLPLRFLANTLDYNVEYNVTDKVITLDKIEDVVYHDIDELLPSKIEMEIAENEYHKKVIEEHSNFQIVETGPSKEEQDKIAKQTEDAIREIFNMN